MSTIYDREKPTSNTTPSDASSTWSIVPLPMKQIYQTYVQTPTTQLVTILHTHTTTLTTFYHDHTHHLYQQLDTSYAWLQGQKQSYYERVRMCLAPNEHFLPTLVVVPMGAVVAFRARRRYQWTTAASVAVAGVMIGWPETVHQMGKRVLQESVPWLLSHANEQQRQSLSAWLSQKKE